MLNPPQVIRGLREGSPVQQNGVLNPGRGVVLSLGQSSPSAPKR